MITIRKYTTTIIKPYRGYLGHIVAQEARNQNIPHEKLHRENHYPKEFLDEYFKNNPTPTFNENCEPITIEMIKMLPIKIFRWPENNENLTSDGNHVFLGKKCIGFWTE